MLFIFKSIIAVLLVMGIARFSCQKEKGLDNATLTGFDQRMCPCCGGLMITFTGETKPYTGAFFLIENSASEFGITAADTFPIYVKVAWNKLEKCKGTYVKITHFKRR